MVKKMNWLLVAVMAIFMLSCSDDDSGITTIAELTVSGGATKDTTTFEGTAVNTAATWITATLKENGKVKLLVTPNTTGNSREGLVTIKKGDDMTLLTVNQLPYVELNVFITRTDGPAGIDGDVVLKVAVSNLGANRAFATSPSDFGKYFIFDDATAYGNGDVPPVRQSYTNEVYTWDEAKDPSPAEWQVPDFYMSQAIFNETRVCGTLNGVDGLWVGENAANAALDNENWGEAIFLPIAGNLSSTGTIVYPNYGSYTGARIKDVNGDYKQQVFSFTNAGFFTPNDQFNLQEGASVRCVMK
jgi:hypothetical protein